MNTKLRQKVRFLCLLFSLLPDVAPLPWGTSSPTSLSGHFSPSHPAIPSVLWLNTELGTVSRTRWGDLGLIVTVGVGKEKVIDFYSRFNSM